MNWKTSEERTGKKRNSSELQKQTEMAERTGGSVTVAEKRAVLTVKPYASALVGVVPLKLKSPGNEDAPNEDHDVGIGDEAEEDDHLVSWASFNGLESEAEDSDDGSSKPLPSNQSNLVWRRQQRFSAHCLIGEHQTGHFNYWDAVVQSYAGRSPKDDQSGCQGEYCYR